MRFTKLATLAVAAGCSLASQGVFAQAMEVVTVEAVREIVVGKSPIGAPIKELTIRSRVSYADLDLTTAAGTATLEKRVKDAAVSSCKEIKVDVPVAGLDGRSLHQGSDRRRNGAGEQGRRRREGQEVEERPGSPGQRVTGDGHPVTLGMSSRGASPQRAASSSRRGRR